MSEAGARLTLTSCQGVDYPWKGTTMNQQNQHTSISTPTQDLATARRLEAALASSSASARLQAAMTAGTIADSGFAGPLIARCAVEPDFSVREMLTWALIRLPRDEVLPRLLPELESTAPQARSQALHTLSKLGDPRGWPAITPALLHDPDAEVAKAAWRAAVAVAPEAEHAGLAAELAAELGRGGTDLKRSLSRAFVELGDAGAAVLDAAAGHVDPAVRAHAAATERLLADPDAAFALEPAEARRLGAAFSGAPRAH